MDAHRRQQVARVAAPVLFLLAATIAVLLVRSALHDHSAAPAKPIVAKKKHHSRTTRTIVPIGATTTAAPAPSVQTYTVASGDTLGTIAAKHGTTIDALKAANPEVDPTAMQIGDTIRLP